MRRWISALPVLMLSSLAPAAPPVRSETAAQPADVPPPPPGKCTYIQPQVKQCSVSTVGGVGAFDVSVAPPAALVITFEEPVTGMQPPPTGSYKAVFSGTTATVVPLRRDPIPGATVHFDTATVHVTLNLRLAANADTQLLIMDPKKAMRDAEVERRLKEAMEGLEERVSEHADQLLLEELVASGVEVADAEVAPSRHGQVVLRAKKVVRVGSRRLVLFSIDNRSGDDLEVKRVRLWYGSDGKERELPQPALQLAKVVHVAEETMGAVSVPLKTLSSGERLRIQVEMTDSEHSVELGGIGLR